MGNSFRFRAAAIVTLFVLIAIAGIAVAMTVGSVNLESCTNFGSGTPEDPYRIYYASQMADIIQKMITYGESYFENKYFIMKNDIDMSSVSFPVVETAFKGVFDGGGHTLSNFPILFRTLGENGVVRNTVFKKIKSPTSAYNYAIIFIVDDGALVENCTVDFTCQFDPVAIEEEGTREVTVSVFSSINRGTIKDCKVTFRWQQISKKVISAPLIISPFAVNNYGKIVNCETHFADCRFDIANNTIGIFGISKTKADSCKVTGDIYVYTSQKDYSYCNKMILRGMAYIAKNCENTLNVTVEYNENLGDFFTYILSADTEENCVYSGKRTDINKPAGSE